jgi:hypothetical protein
LAVPEIFNAIEQTAFSHWLRETPSVFGFYFFLTVHAMGMSLLVGSSMVIDLRLLGVAASIPLKPLKGLFTIMWIGFIANVVTGLLLVTAYPTKEFTNYDFYFKLTFVTLSMIVMRKIYFQVFNDAGLSEGEMVARGKVLAKWSLFFWIVAVTLGRLLSETAIYETYGHRAGG